MIDYIGELYESNDWDALEQLDTRDFCPICLIKKKSKVRHVRNVEDLDLR